MKKLIILTLCFGIIGTLSIGDTMARTLRKRAPITQVNQTITTTSQSETESSSDSSLLLLKKELTKVLAPAAIDDIVRRIVDQPQSAADGVGEIDIEVEPVNTCALCAMHSDNGLCPQKCIDECNGCGSKDEALDAGTSL